MWVGVDGCRHGWLSVALLEDGSWTFAVDPSAEELWERWRNANLILLDIPIGLVDAGDERPCDRTARKIIGPRRSSVFPAPSRAALHEQTYTAGSAANHAATGRKLTQQSWAIVSKIREVDNLLCSNTEARRSIREVHPEVLFWALNDGKTLSYSKKRSAGVRERLGILEKHFPAARSVNDEILRAFPRRQVAADDILDALAAAVTGYRSRGDVQNLPGQRIEDSAGLPMEMVFWGNAIRAAH
jgi:predicted RNase H-like nuclease